MGEGVGLCKYDTYEERWDLGKLVSARGEGSRISRGIQMRPFHRASMTPAKIVWGKSQGGGVNIEECSKFQV